MKLFLVFLVFASIALGQEPQPAPAPEPPAPPKPTPPPPVEDFVFDQFQNVTHGGPGDRVGYIIVGSDASYFDLVGGDINGVAENVVWRFNTSTTNPSWSNFTLNFTRINACASGNASDQSLWIFGGRNNSETPLQNEIFSYNTTSKSITRISEASEFGPSHSSVSCVVTNVNQLRTLFVFGGENASSPGECTNDLYSYDTKNWTLHSVTKTNAPLASTGASVVLVNNTVLAVFGGGCQNTYNAPTVHRFDITKGEWTVDNFTEPAPTARKNHVALVFGNSMVVYGGQDINGTLNDVWVYDLKNCTWKNLNISTPTPRNNISYGTSLTRVFLYGGQNQTTLNDTWQLVSEQSCLQYSQKCDECTLPNNGCGWCSGNDLKYQCVAGTPNGLFVNKTCKSPDAFSTDILNCPEFFPSWAIALIVIGGVVLIGITVFAIMKIREKPEYQEIR